MRAVAGIGGGTGGAEEGFRRHTADIQAITAEEMAFDECDFSPETGGAGSGHKAGGAAADHDEIVARRGRGVHPIGRMNLGMQAAVVGIPRLQRRGVVHGWEVGAGAAAVRLASAARARRVTNTVTTMVAARPTP